MAARHGNSAAAQARPFWLDPPAQAPGDAPPRGLTCGEAARRLEQYGANVLRTGAQQSLLGRYFYRFRNPLVIILLFASVVSAFSGEVTNFIIIVAMIFFSVTLDFLQEYRASAAAEKLRQSVSVRASVLRDGERIEVAVQEVVPGDIALLAAGDLVPADGLLLEARDFFVSQALLTGEPYPVEKRPEVLPASATEIQDAGNAVFMGTSVISGTACMQVMKTGRDTALGDIAESLARSEAPTSFEIGTRRFGLLIMRLTILLVMFVLLVNALFHRPWLESFLFAVALAVGLTPELLPMVVTVTLARGALRMAGQQAIVKRLSAIHDLGSMDVLCTDKTGTLTEARIRMERHVDAGGRDSERVVQLAYLNSWFETGLRSPLDDAILAHEHIDVGDARKVDEVPFDFERRRVSVLLDRGGERQLIVKGAPEDIIALSRRYEVAGGDGFAPIDDAARATIVGQYRALEAEGFRVLGIAWRAVPAGHDHARVDDEAELTLVGFAAFLDPPKASAATALAALGRAGVDIKILTGDSELVTQYVCAELGIPVTGILTGRDLAAMDDHALGARVESVNLYCRVNPAQKNRVIEALRRRQHVVGYLGDGINDAPALHSADVGVSVDSAVDVAREAADIILLKQDLHVLHAGVREGRRTFGNIQKYMLMGTSSNFGNMFSMAGAALFLPFLPMLPTQILLNNILYDISEVPIPLDEVDAEEVAQPRTLEIGLLQNFMLVIGPISSLFDFLTFFVMLVLLGAGEQLFQTGWFVESLCTQVLVIFVIRTRRNPFASRPHPALVLTSLAVALIALLLPFTAIGAQFGFVPLPAIYFVILGSMVLVYLVIVELVKQRFYRWSARSGAHH